MIDYKILFIVKLKLKMKRSLGVLLPHLDSCLLPPLMYVTRVLRCFSSSLSVLFACGTINSIIKIKAYSNIISAIQFNSNWNDIWRLFEDGIKKNRNTQLNLLINK